MPEPTTWGIDGDIIAYSVGFAAEDDPVNYAITSARSMAQDIINACGTEGIIYLTGKGNYRTTEADPDFPYKGNRKDAPKPRHLEDIRRYLIEELGAVVAEGEEADDLMGIGAVQYGHGIATLDKDLDGVPGWHYNWKKNTTYHVTELEADRFFYMQLLTGDSTDNIPGLFKRTNKKAMAKIKAPLQEMEDVQEMYDYVHQVYVQAAPEPALVDDWLYSQARCLWIRRDVAEMWEPPCPAE